ncbi:TrbI/VirB10 family protein [Nostoc sp. 2RC]|uniref:TrbI/VirB10 family protein n=1 Tax=Nostoc sp. 2RC TaxID=2485484 RepID=UPI0021AB6E37|nr:TrbI/VirB10 family protein [Nostoc sp. 2RC]
MAGINKAAELLNRSDTTYQYRDINNNPQILTNYNKRNIAAGILEGGFNYLVPQIAQRNQQAITQMLQKTNIWFLPAGKEVEIYVNHTVQF